MRPTSLPDPGRCQVLVSAKSHPDGNEAAVGRRLAATGHGGAGEQLHVRRRTVLDRVAGWTYLAVLTMLVVPGAASGVLMAVEGGLSSDLLVYLAASAGVLTTLAWMGLVSVRPRLVADVDGLHVRGALRTRHLPWPVSRGELVTVPAMGVGLCLAVQVRPADGSRRTTIRALTRSLSRRLEGPSAEQEILDLWKWGLDHGCVASSALEREREPMSPARGSDPRRSATHRLSP